MTVLGLSAPLAAAPGAARASEQSLPYRVVDGRVDPATLTGWRIFHTTCYACHGMDAEGSDVAPSLVGRVGGMTPVDFAVAVLFRYPVITGFEPAPGDDLPRIRRQFAEAVARHEKGEVRMPAWDDHPAVEPHLMDLYAYLRARADGALGPGQPQPEGDGQE